MPAPVYILRSMSTAKDLSKVPPRSPNIRLRDYVILARAIDKCRSEMAGVGGDYHFNCPLDQTLFAFKGIDSEDFKKSVETAEQDDDVALWFDQAGIHKTQHEIQEWSDDRAADRPYDNPELREWFAGECARLGINPAETTLFQYLDIDDAATFKS